MSYWAHPITNDISSPSKRKCHSYLPYLKCHLVASQLKCNAYLPHLKCHLVASQLKCHSCLLRTLPEMSFIPLKCHLVASQLKCHLSYLKCHLVASQVKCHSCLLRTLPEMPFCVNLAEFSLVYSQLIFDLICYFSPGQVQLGISRPKIKYIYIYILYRQVYIKNL